MSQNADTLSLPNADTENTPRSAKRDHLTDQLQDPLSGGKSLQLDVGTPTGGGSPSNRAAQGLTGGGGSLPFGDRIQASFGRHDISGVKAHTGPTASAAADSLGASAYAMGDSIAFKGTPTLHTAAHEAAHTVQQRDGVQLKDEVGRSGDAYEQNADHVADLVVSGRSAESALDLFSSGSAPSVQLAESEDQQPPDMIEWEQVDGQWQMDWDGSTWIAELRGDDWYCKTTDGKREGRHEDMGWRDWETTNSSPSTARKVGGAVAKGLGGAVLGPFKLLLQTYRDDIQAENELDYHNSILNGVNQVSAFTGYMAAMMGWSVLVMGLAAAIVSAASGGTAAPVAALVLAGTVPIFGWLAATFAAITSALKLFLGISSAIRIRNMKDSVKRAQLRARIWPDLVSGLCQAGAAAVGGAYAGAGGGAYATSLDSQVTSAIATDTVKDTAVHSGEQGINQIFNSAFDASNEFTEDQASAKDEAEKRQVRGVVQTLLARLAEKRADVNQRKASKGKMQEAAGHLGGSWGKLRAAIGKDPAATAQRAAAAEPPDEADLADIASTETEGNGNANAKKYVSDRDGELRGADARLGEEQSEDNVSEGTARAQESKSVKPAGWFRRKWNALFSGASRRATARVGGMAARFRTLPPEAEQSLSSSAEDLDQAPQQLDSLDQLVNVEESSARQAEDLLKD